MFSYDQSAVHPPCKTRICIRRTKFIEISKIVPSLFIGGRFEYTIYFTWIQFKSSWLNDSWTKEYFTIFIDNRVTHITTEIVVSFRRSIKICSYRKRKMLFSPFCYFIILKLNTLNAYFCEHFVIVTRVSSIRLSTILRNRSFQHNATRLHDPRSSVYTFKYITYFRFSLFRNISVYKTRGNSLTFWPPRHDNNDNNSNDKQTAHNKMTRIYNMKFSFHCGDTVFFLDEVCFFWNGSSTSMTQYGSVQPITDRHGV